MARIEGRNPVTELLKGNRDVYEILIQKGIRGDTLDWIIKEARGQNINIKYLDKRALDKRANTANHQGIIAFAEGFQFKSPEYILESAEKKEEPPFVVILDQIQDPYNFGAIIRTAYTAGAHGIVFPEKRSSGITPVVVKASAGAVEHIPLVRVSNINYLIAKLKDAGLWIAGADLNGKNVYKTDLKGPLAIVIGNEGKGLRRLVKENCDFLVKIPMKGKLDSLNASVAAGIIIYEAVRQKS